ncbi:hypothetical protein [Saccharomonospora sp. NB11]|jgi:hypothetical protein|uniref:hypothetical protein n=1 Tax=Saccharomonospora sp. NB11 TaxID=1642298 RepID=UPI0018D1ED9D|nr:hypothetical protein [Saccharomonospora sp. NB11]
MTPNIGSKWNVIQEHSHPRRALLRYKLRKNCYSALVARMKGGEWASSHLQLGSTVNISPLTAGLAFTSQKIEKLYEVDLRKQTVAFNSVLETENEGAVVEADVAVHWQVRDPVRLILSPEIDILSCIQDSVEEVLRPIVLKIDIDRLESVFEQSEALQPMRMLDDLPISWGEGTALLRLTSEGRIHRHTLESIRRARAIEKEQRMLDRERIDFYTSVINSGQVSLLALMLSNDKTAAPDVLQYIEQHELQTNGPAPSDDPLQAALNHIISGADEFELHEMRRDLLAGLQRRNPEDEFLGEVADKILKQETPPSL